MGKGERKERREERPQEGKGRLADWEGPGLRPVPRGAAGPKTAVLILRIALLAAANHVGWPCFTTLVVAHAAQRGPQRQGPRMKHSVTAPATPAVGSKVLVDGS